MRKTSKPKGLTIDALQKTVATQVIEMIETDGLAWFQRWAAARSPLNGVSGHVYSGINTFTTSLWLMGSGQSDPRFLSAGSLFAKDASKRVGQLRKGEKGIPILAAGTYTKKDTETDEKQTRTFYKIHHVWHVSQLEEVDEARLVSPFAHSLPTIPAERNSAIDAFIANTGAIIGQDSKAVYRPSTDSIGMPPMDTFRHTDDITAEEFYYATVFHELIHWTGASSRLARPSLADYGKDKTARAKEELIAELGAVMLGMRLGIQPQPREDNANYIKGWVSLLQDTPGAIFDAASAAGKAASYLVDLQPERITEDEDA